MESEKITLKRHYSTHLIRTFGVFYIEIDPSYPNQS